MIGLKHRQNSSPILHYFRSISPHCQTTSYGFDTTLKRIDMTHLCPNCQSDRIGILHHGRKLGGTIGTLSGVILAVRNAQTGALIGASVGPLGVVAGGLAGLALSAFKGGIIGATTGVSLGSLIDASVLNNCKCLSCGYTFSLPNESHQKGEHHPASIQTDNI